MNWRTLILICLFAGLIGEAGAQSFTISGTFRDAGTGEELIGANIIVKDLKNVGASSNEYGFYSLTLPAGNYALQFSYVGYETKNQTFKIDKNLRIDIKLQAGNRLAEVVVISNKREDNITRTQMGVEKMDIKEIANLPVLFGEKDVLKSIQLLPGVKSAGEGNSGFYVRGGSADQNLVLLDEAPVYNASHLLGFFSTFNSDAIKDATLMKGNSPAQYGGRLASVLDLRMKEGNDKDYTVAGGIGLISSRLSIEGPISKEKSSFIIAARRTYADLFLRTTNKYKNNSLYFYDLNAKANYRINERNRIFLSGYFGRDLLGLEKQFGIDWGNITGTLRWNRIVSQKLFSNTSMIYSDYNYKIKLTSSGIDFNISSQIHDWNFKQEFSWYPNANNSWKFGLNSVYHTMNPTRFQGNVISVANNGYTQVRHSLEDAFYVNNTQNISRKLHLDYGLRFSAYTILGVDTYNIYKGDIKTGSVYLGKGEIGKTYLRPEPRLSANYIIDEKMSIKLGYSRNTQNLHLLSNSTTTSPTDQWIGNSYNIKPESSDQVSTGIFRNFAADKYELSFETYYKSMNNQIDYKNGADIFTVADVESELLYGKGRAYGAEFQIKKNSGRVTGWLSYTLSRTERLIDGINEGKWYPAKQDRTHDVSIVGIWHFAPCWSASAAFVYYTGNAVTFPSGKYSINGRTVYYYTERNGYRMPNYHRLDLGVSYEKKREGKYQTSWNFGLYNVYGRENAYTITFEDDPENSDRTRAVQTSLFRWVPSVTWNFKF